MSEDNRPVTIGIGSLCSKFITFSVELTIGIISILGYQSLNDVLRAESISKWLLAHIIFTMIRAYLYFRLVAIICFHYGQVMPADEWKAKISKDISTLGGWLDYSQLGSFITSMYFLNRYNADDDTYMNARQAQMAVNAIAIYFTIYLCLIVVIIVLMILMLCAVCLGISTENTIGSGSRSESEPGSIYHSQVVQGHNAGTPFIVPENRSNRSISQMFSRAASFILPIHTPTEEICSICMETFKGSDEWITLPCRHIFHPQCINPWIAGKNTCPNCRATVNLT
jgi:hypothetical protein